MAILVQKFGGTSVGNAERLLNVADIIAASLVEHQVIAVVSAMSGTVKAEGTTTLLLQAADAALLGHDFSPGLALLTKNHEQAVSGSVKNEVLRIEVLEFVAAEIGKLRAFLQAISVIRELSPRSQDIVMGLGERLSARVLTAVLRDRGIDAEFKDLSQVVPEDEHSVDPAFFKRLQARLGAECAPVARRVPVVTGFIGMVPGGLLSAVGRGYTDFTAAMIAAGLGRERAQELQVWKEVDGIFTTDPRKVASARVLPRISPAEAAELTYFGSEVLHPFTMERVVSAQVPIRIKNTFKPNAPGTVIAPYEQERPRGATAITVKRGITSLTISSNRMFNAYGFLARVFAVLDKHGVVVDLVSTSEVSISCTIEKPADAERARADLEQLGSVSVSAGRAILALVGEGMKFSTGTAGKMFATLGAAGINLEMISQGASEINISCVIAEGDTIRALEALHAAFLAG